MSSRALTEVAVAFLRLGVTSFGGPVAHLGYFHDEFVVRRRWLDDAEFSRLVALCQFLPGPASSQLGFALGLQRAGFAGASLAWLAFTLPSALLMYAFARLSPAIGGTLAAAALHGLKLVAVAVVGAALLGMARTLARGLPRAAIAVAAAILVVALDAAWSQLAAIGAGALAGRWLCRDAAMAPPGARGAVSLVTPRAVLAGALFLCGLLAALALTPRAGAAPDLPTLAAAFWRAGALVFGGGHVVLPLLEQATVGPGWISPDRFLAGYGAAQAVPGPMFSLAAYLGAGVPAGAPPPVVAALALVAMFAPGLLLVLALQPAWSRIGTAPAAAAAVAGVNAAVVGLLAAAFVDPVWQQGVRDAGDALVAASGFALLAFSRTPALLVVAGCVAASVARAALAG